MDEFPTEIQTVSQFLSVLFTYRNLGCAGLSRFKHQTEKSAFCFSHIYLVHSPHIWALPQIKIPLAHIFST